MGLLYQLQISDYASILFVLMFLSIAVTSILEIQWGWTIYGETSNFGLSVVSQHIFLLFSKVS